MTSLIGTLAFSDDAQPLVPADCLRQPLNSNVRHHLKTNRTFVAIALAASAFVQASEVRSREDIMRIFHSYETLNADFVRSASTGTGRSGKPYAELRREAEAYAEGPFAHALLRARDLLCASQDRELLASLLQVAMATSNSANEAPTEALVNVAKCQPSQLKALAPSLSAQQRTELARRAPELKVVFK